MNTGSDGPGPMVVGFDQMAAGFDGVGDLVDIDGCCALAHRVLEGEGVIVGQLDLILVDPDDMAELNELHMGHDGPTDVLSFPMDADLLDQLLADQTAVGRDGGGHDGGPPVHLGDVVICPAVAEQQAPDHCGSFDAELSLLIIHGVLHILGHDHAEPDETITMQARERHHLSAYGFDHPVPR